MPNETILCPNCGRWILFPEGMEMGACPACGWVRRRAERSGQVPGAGESSSAVGIAARSVFRTLLIVGVCIVGAFATLVFVLFAGCLVMAGAAGMRH